MSFRPRWYGADVLKSGTGRRWPELDDRVPVGDDALRRVRALPRELVALAGEEYERQHSQTFERVNQRGGLGLIEIIMLMGDALERERAISAPFVTRTPRPRERRDLNSESF